MYVFFNPVSFVKPTSLLRLMVMAFFLQLSLGVNAATYYVSSADSRANDGNNGLSASAPLRSIDAALSKVRSGDTLLLKGGDVWSIRQTVTLDVANLKVNVYGSNALAVLDGEGAYPDVVGSALLKITAKGVSVSNVELRDSGQRALHIVADGARISKVRVDSPWTGGIQIDDADNVWVTDSTVIGANLKFGTTRKDDWGGGIVAKSATNFVIKDNTVLLGWGEGIAAWHGAKGGNISNNYVFAHHAIGIYINAAQRIDIVDNTVVGTGLSDYWRADGYTGAGIALNNEVFLFRDWGLADSEVTSDINIYNNRVAGTDIGLGVWGAYEGTHYKNLRIIHNTFVDNNYQFSGVKTASFSSSVVANNMFLSLVSDHTEVGGGLGSGGVTWQSNFWSEVPRVSTMRSSSDVIGGARLARMSGWHDSKSATAIKESDFAAASGSTTLNRARALSTTYSSFYNGKMNYAADIGAIAGSVIADAAPMPPTNVSVW